MKICFLLSLLIGIQAFGSVLGYYGIYGNIASLNPTGASQATASSDGLNYKGVRASQKMARTDLAAMNKYKRTIVEAARAKNFDPAVIAGIISRESRAGKVLRNGWGDHGNAFGLMQIDKRYHTPTGAWDSVTHVKQGSQILIDSIRAVLRKKPNWSQAQQLQGGVAAYNFGVRNVRSWGNLDGGTTHNDYSNDVIARAKYYRDNGYN